MEPGLCSATFAHRHTYAHTCTPTQGTHTHMCTHTCTVTHAGEHIPAGAGGRGYSPISGLELEEAVTGQPLPAPALRETVGDERASQQLDPRPKLESLKHQPPRPDSSEAATGPECTCEARVAS